MSDPVTRLNAALEGRYAIERELGEGGMATVYLADDLKHERKVALKVLKPEVGCRGGRRGMTHRDWTDPRDGKHWLLWLERAERRGVLAFAADGKQFTAEVRSDTPLADVTDNEIEALLDRARG